MSLFKPNLLYLWFSFTDSCSNKLKLTGPMCTYYMYYILICDGQKSKTGKPNSDQQSFG